MKPFCYDFPRPGLTVDIAICSFFESKLRILLIERGIEPFKGHWALPGGFVNEDEDVFQAAKRELFEETNLQITKLEQLYFASQPGRDPRGWTVSSVLIGFTNGFYENIKAGDDAKNLKWFPVNELPILAFDHHDLIKKLIEYLVKTAYFSIPDRELLPPQFSIVDLKLIYSELGIKNGMIEKLMDRSKKINLLQEISKDTYSFNDLVYDKIRNQGTIEE